MGRALSGGDSIGVCGLKYELVLAEDADDLIVDSEANNGGG